MFLFLKIVEPLILLPSLTVICLFVVVMMWERRSTWTLELLMFATALLYVFSIEPTAVFMTHQLQKNISPLQRTVDADAIVVLAGGATAGPLGAMPELGGASWRRFWHGIEQYRSHEGSIPLIYAGGTGDPFSSDGALEGETAKTYAQSMGVDIEMETQSRTTAESAQAVKEMLETRVEGTPTVVLVTSALHMRRSMGTFSRAGMIVIPAPADYMDDATFDLLSVIPTSASLHASVRALHEAAGMIWYAVTGRV